MQWRLQGAQRPLPTELDDRRLAPKTAKAAHLVAYNPSPKEAHIGHFT